MCNPIVVVAMVALSAYMKSRSDKQQAEYQSKVAKNNATIADFQQHDAAQRGRQAVQDQLQKTAQIRSAQTSSLAARGLDIGSGSALSLLQDTDFMGRRDANTIDQNSKMEQWGLGIQEQNYQSSSDLYKNTANNIHPIFDGLMAGAQAYAGMKGGGGGTVSDKNAGTKPPIVDISLTREQSQRLRYNDVRS